MPNLAISDANQALHLFLLGTFRVAIGPRVIDDAKWRRRKASALLKLLALAPSYALHREQIIEQLWPDVATRAGANNFHQALYLARHILEPKHTRSTRWLRLEGDFLSLSPDEPVWIDVEAFQAAAVEAQRRHDPALYRQALDLYGGELLPEDRYADWTLTRRESLHQEYIALLMGLAESQTTANQLDAAIATLQQLVANEPAHEHAHRTLMELYAITGKREQALAQFELLRGALQKELDAEPDESSQELYQRILAGHLQPVATEPRAPVHNLPVQLTSFIGREQELDQVERLVQSSRLLTLTGPGGCGKTRLALEVARRTVDAYAYGAWFVDLAPLSDPAFVPRALANVLGVPEATGKPISETLVAFLRSKQILILLDNCEHLAEACATLCDALLRACSDLSILATSREPLHISGEILWLVPSLPLPTPDQLPALPELGAYPAIRLFVERARAVAASFDLNPTNAPVVAQLCFHLDGIPLAIELAAARVNMLAVEQILARLDDRFRLLTGASRTALNRQQTLQAAIDWSYDLLSEPERTLFRELTVFAGGWTLEAVEFLMTVAPPATVTGVRGNGGDANPSALPHSQMPTLDLLSRLVDKSLVLVEQSQGESRFRMLETIREYARRRLDESGESQAVLARLCAWCIAFVEQVNPQSWGKDHTRWVRHLESEHENMRVALAWCVEHDPNAGLRLAILLNQFWVLRGYVQEALGWLHRLLAHAPEPTARRARARLMQVLLKARIGNYSANYWKDLEDLNESLSIYDRLGDKAGQVLSYLTFGGITLVTTSCERAKSLFELALALARETGAQAAIACATHFLGVHACMVGDYDRADALLGESLALLREHGSETDIAPLFLNISHMPWTYGVRRRWWVVEEETLVLNRQFSAQAAIGFALANRANTARARGNAFRARELYEASQAHFAEIGDQSGLAQILGQLGYLYISQHDDARGRTVLETSLAIRRELGDRRGVGRSLNNLAHAAILNGDYVQARAWLDESLALFQEMIDIPGLAQTFNHLGNWALEHEDFALAASFYERSLNFFNDLGRRGAGYILLNLAECARGVSDQTMARVRLEQARAALMVYGDLGGVAAADKELRTL